MSTPPQPPKADAGMEKLFSRLPGLIEQARKGTMMPQAITQLRQLLRDRRPAIDTWYKANNMPSPFPTLPPSINPAIPVLGNSVANSPQASPAPSGQPAVVGQSTTAARPPPPRPGAAPRPPAPAQTVSQVRPNLQPTAPPLARPPTTTAPPPNATVRPPGARPPAGIVAGKPTGTATPTASATNTPSPGVSGPASRTGTPSGSVPKVTSWTDVFNMTADQRRSWFDAVPGSEATYNKILEDARKKHMAMRQGDGTGSRAGSPAPSGAGSRAGSPAPTGGPGSPAAVSKEAPRPGNGQGPAGQVRPPAQGGAASATRAIRPVNQNMPLPNLAIPPGARRGSATGDAPGTPSAATTAMAPENRPPAGIHSLSQDKIRFYMSLSDAQGQVLPHDQKQLWLWLKKLIQETKQQTANKAAAGGTPQRPGVRPGMGIAGQPGSYGAGFRMPSAPGGLSMANLNEEISKLYTDGKAPTMAQLRELCMRGGLTWSAQMENLVAPYASDRAKHQAMAGSGMKMDPIEVPQTPMGGPTQPMVPRTLKEHVHENVRRVVEYEVGNSVDDDLVSIFEGLAGDLFTEVLSGSAALAKARRREAPSLDVRDVAEIARQTMGITIPGFGLEQAQIGKRKALPSRMNERHLKKLRAVQKAKDRDAGRI